MVIGRAWRNVDRAAVRAAITAAEHGTSGQIAVSIAGWFWGNVDAAARKAFDRLHVAHTTHHNGVLLFVVPARRRFVVLGDAAIHDKVGQSFWDATVAAMSDRFRAGDWTGGLVHGIETVGAQLAAHFPHDAADANELPDEPELR